MRDYAVLFEITTYVKNIPKVGLRSRLPKNSVWVTIRFVRFKIIVVSKLLVVNALRKFRVVTIRVRFYLSALKCQQNLYTLKN